MSVQYFRGPLPPIGARVRHYHPWLQDHAVGTVYGYEPVEPLTFQFMGSGGQMYHRMRVLLTNCEHWTADHTWGPVENTYFDTLSESWSYDDGADLPCIRHQDGSGVDRTDVAES